MEKIIKPSPALLMGEGKLSATVDAPEATLTATPMSPPKPPWYKQLKDSAFAGGMAMAAGKKFFESAWGMIESAWGMIESAWGMIQKLFRQRAAQDLTGPPKT